VAPLEERRADECLERLDLAAHRRLREEELGRGAREAQVPGGGLEAAQELERGKGAVRASHAWDSCSECTLFVCRSGPMAAFCMHATHSSRNNMQLNLKTPLLALEAGQVVTLDDAQGTRIIARSGTVWVTEEGETHDHIVGPGDALVVARSGRTVVQALKSAWISLTQSMAPANDDVPAHIQPVNAVEACDEARSRVPYY
jgi:hypothetical protein